MSAGKNPTKYIERREMGNKGNAKLVPFYLNIRIEPDPVSGLDIDARELMHQVQMMVVDAIGARGKCATILTTTGRYPLHAPHSMWAKGADAAE